MSAYRGVARFGRVGQRSIRVDMGAIVDIEAADRGTSNQRERAYERFTRHLLARDIKAGQFISQRELVALTGLSLGAIRELIPRLETEGLIRTVPQRGMQVAHVDLNLIRDAFQFRLFLEREAIASYAAQVSDGSLDRFWDSHTAMVRRYETAAAKGSISVELVAQAEAIDWNFHATIIDALGNAIPAGFSTGHAVGDANSFTHWLLWSHGGAVVDEGGKVMIDSKETIAALKYCKALYETFIPGTQAWGDPSNNKAMLAGEIGLTQNGVSVYYAFKNSEVPKIVELAADVDHARMPIGPVGHGTETALVVNSMIFKHTKYPNAAKAFLTFLMEEEQYDKWLVGAAGYWAHPLKAYEASSVWTSDPKIAAYRDTMKDSLWYGFKGPIGDASAAVVSDYVVVDMFASVCAGSSSPEEAATEAARRASRYYK